RKEHPHIQLRTFDRGNNLVFQIIDKGIGIAKESQEKIFQKFYRVPTGNVHDVKGFGLGLFYVNNICKTHAWKLNLESAPQEGTTVTITIPAQ
ncbi:MAG: ATP-binding protein, partial [Bacteroidota bacterium]